MFVKCFLDVLIMSAAVQHLRFLTFLHRAGTLEWVWVAFRWGVFTGRYSFTLQNCMPSYL